MPSIVVLARHYYPAPGAATSRLRAMVRSLKNDGWDVVVITRSIPGEPEERVGSGPDGELILRVHGDAQTGVTVRRLLNLVLFPILVVLHGRRAIAAADVVIADPPPTVGLAMLVLARNFRAKSVYYLADSWEQLLTASDSTLARVLRIPAGRLEKFVWARADLVVPVTTGLRQLAERRNAQCAYIPNGVDGAIFRYGGPKMVPRDFGVSEPYFLYAGNFGEAHGVGILVDAARELWDRGSRSFSMVFIGYGSDQGLVNAAAAKYPDRLKVLTPQSEEFTAQAFRGAIAGLVSVKDHADLQHAVPVKALASLMTGCPVLYVGGGGLAERIVYERRLGRVARRNRYEVGDLMEEFACSPWDATARSLVAETAAAYYDNRRHSRRLVQTLTSIVENTPGFRG